ncbi:nucleotidyltransferase family protein [Microaerobacter geothermalis]|uniref:nucleotidyltransferase family protein n=1 Tax=Microaerobacter geothermalis TaxID=674972 RepID=UPI001F1DBE39|nr:nucleotidyltransferase family protein [Microaerobacter geothermalis]MCF6093281.1 nucleotidyltransferase family protein [Microaerobacter geothermalis]
MGVFGSYARNEQTDNSDIDILVEFSRPVGFEFFDLKDYLESLFNKPIDLVTVKALKPYIKEEILSEVQFQ